jgi:hypothetical protein
MGVIDPEMDYMGCNWGCKLMGWVKICVNE